VVEIDLPEVVEEVTAAFADYEAAIMGNDADGLIGKFWAHPKTIRYGLGENLHGIDEIIAFRRAQASAGGYFARRLVRTVITTYGHDFATASTTYVRDADGRQGRQMQTWLRTPEGWRVVAAHVSLLPVNLALNVG
jgi:hypothetical protein